MASLIEYLLNNGVHTAAEASMAVDPLLPAMVRPALRTNGDIPESADPADVLSSGASALIAGARLPCRPAPMLELPWGDVALSEAFSEAARRYGDWFHPQGVIRVCLEDRPFEVLLRMVDLDDTYAYWVWLDQGVPAHHRLRAEALDGPLSLLADSLIGVAVPRAATRY